MAAVLTTAIFLGRLSVYESRRLSHRLVKYAVFKMVFVGSVITPDPRDVVVWLAWFSVIGFLRIFLGAAKDRLESLLIAPGAQLGRHARGVCLLVLVLLYNVASFVMVLRLLPRQTMARMLLCAFDSTVIAIEGAKTLLRYTVHMMDRYVCLQAVPPAAADPTDDAADRGGEDTGAVAAAGGLSAGGGWDAGGGAWASGKSSFLYHVELVADLLVHAVTLAHYLHVWVLHGLSFHIIDAVLFLDMRAVLLSLLRRLRTHLTYRAATHRINNTFPDVPAAALAAAGAGGADCTICMDGIQHTAKQLPCGHVFHLSCLRAWLQQSGSETFTCPNCRQPILVRGAGGEGGAGRREAEWWLVRVVDRAYVRLVVAVEPLLLTLLLRWTLWLRGRTHSRRRVARLQPSQPREGFGESPGPLHDLRASVAGEYQSDSDPADEEELDEDEQEGEEEELEAQETADEEELYRSVSSEGCPRDGRERDRRDAGAAADAGGSLEAAGQPTGSWQCTRRGCGGAAAGGHRCDHCFPRPGQARSPADSCEPKQQPRAATCLGYQEHTGGAAQGWRAGAAAAGADPLAGPPAGTAAAATRYRSRRNLPPLAPEVPSYSGDVLPRHAAAAARRLGRTVTASIRSSWGVGGVCAGAVAAGGLRGGEDSDQEVCSRRRHVQTSRRKPRAVGGDGESNRPQ